MFHPEYLEHSVTLNMGPQDGFFPLLYNLISTKASSKIWFNRSLTVFFQMPCHFQSQASSTGMVGAPL